MNDVKKIHVIVNPAASGNAGSVVWAGISHHFESLFDGFDYTVSEPVSREHAAEIAHETDADMLISVSGDGALHNLAQAITRRPREMRPALSVLPVGSGNDFAKSLGISKDPVVALQEIRSGRRHTIDVGSCNGTVFMETLSFGIDAAIAVGTEEKRKTSRMRGFTLYASVAVSAIVRELKKHRFAISFEDGTVINRDLLICAVQNGPTYGGGFRVAPQAVINDGLLNLCLAGETNKVFALFALALMSGGRHENLKIFETVTAKQLTIDLDDDIYVQCDGEQLRGQHFEIEILPAALDVIGTECAAVTASGDAAVTASGDAAVTASGDAAVTASGDAAADVADDRSASSAAGDVADDRSAPPAADVEGAGSK